MSLTTSAVRGSSAGPERGWGDPAALVLFAAAVAGGVLLARHQSRTVEPFVPTAALVEPAIVRSLAGSVLLGAIMYGTLFYLPTELHARYGYSPTESAFGLLPYILAFAATSVLAGRLTGNPTLVKPVVAAGGGLILAGMALFGLLPADTGYPMVAIALIVLGVGAGCVMQTLVTLAQQASSTKDIAVVTSLVVTVRGIGMAAAGAIVGLLLASGLSLAATMLTMLWATPIAAGLLVLLVTLRRPDPIPTGLAQT